MLDATKTNVSAAEAWMAGFTQRWHMHPKLSKTQDQVMGHSNRVAVLALLFRPQASASLLRACIVHDLGESKVGDIAYPAKKRNPALREELERMELHAMTEMGLPMPVLSPEDAEILHFADRLDALLWAIHHEPDMVFQNVAWIEHYNRMAEMADKLDLTEMFESLIEGVTNGTF